MKNIFIASFLFIFLEIISCRCSHVNSMSAITHQDSVNSSVGKTTGTISHKYKNTGCGSVIIFSDNEETIILIPKDLLPDTVDKEGNVISFNYHLLKMPNPKGCMVGIPAEITDIEMKK